MHTQDFGIHAPARKSLVSLVRSELNPEFASRRERVYGVSVNFGFKAVPLKEGGQIGKCRRDHNEVGIESVDRLDATIDR